MTESPWRSLGSVLNAEPQVVADGDEWAVILPGVPITGSGKTREEAVTDTVAALREYAADWPRLKDAPNHRGYAGLVVFVSLASDDDVERWLTGQLSLQSGAVTDAANLPRVRFHTKVSHNARAVRTMFRHPRGVIVDARGRPRAFWELTDPPTPRPTPLRPVPVKKRH